MRADAGKRHDLNGRYARKLSSSQVLHAQERHRAGQTLASIAAELGVSYQAVAYHVGRQDRDVTLEWLRTVPAYRNLIRCRVAEAARRAEALSNRIDRQYVGVDYLGREVEGCG